MNSDGHTRLQREPLWDRADRNRTAMTGFVVLFVVLTALLVSASIALAPTLGTGAVLGIRGALESDAEQIGWALSLARAGLLAFAVLFPVTLLVTSGYCALALRGSRDQFAAALGAVPPVTDDPRYAATRRALVDAMTVTGAPSEPRLYALPDAGDAVNACAFGRSAEQSGIAVTPGFATRLGVDEQRALLAALVSRVASGDAARATAFVSIMVPLINVRDAENPFDNDPTSLTVPLGMIWTALADSARVLARVLNRGSWLAYEKADAEAMLALRDPIAMLRALDELATADTTIAVNSVFEGLFVTALDGDAAVTADESTRLTRMREVLGVDGATFVPGSETTG